MPYLLDGNNLIGRYRGASRPGEADRDALVAELSSRLRATRARATIFFDGPAARRPLSLGSLAVRCAGGSADDAIVREVERARAPGEMTVVTSDRELARRVRDAGGAVCAPAEFFARFGQGARTAGTREEPGRVDVEEWLRYFSSAPPDEK